MKITFVTPHFGLPGGVRVLAIYARLLRARGHDITIVSQPLSAPSRRQRLASLARLGHQARSVDKTPYLAGLDVEHIVLETTRPVTNADLPDADVVVATWWETAFWVATLAPEKGRKFYFVQHHEVHPHLPWQISRGSYYLPLKKIAVSQWLVDIMAGEYGDTDVTLVPNGVDMGQFDAPPRERQPVPTIGLMYAAAPFKGTDVSLEAVRLVRERLGEVDLVAFGSKTPVLRLPLPEGTRFVLNPAQAAIRDIYAACDVWLFGSRAEGFGLPLLEALACRTPVIATRAGAAPDLIRNGVNGHVVDIDDTAAMADRIGEVLSLAPQDWRAMSEAAHETARRNTWDRMTVLFEHALMARADDTGATAATRS